MVGDPKKKKHNHVGESHYTDALGGLFKPDWVQHVYLRWHISLILIEEMDVRGIIPRLTRNMNRLGCVMRRWQR